MSSKQITIITDDADMSTMQLLTKVAKLQPTYPNPFNSMIDMSRTVAINCNQSFSNEFDIASKLRKIQVLGGRRLDKIEQHWLMRQYAVTCPKAWYNEDSLTGLATVANFDVKSDYRQDDIVVKPVRGARSVGVRKVNRQELGQMFKGAFDKEALCSSKPVCYDEQRVIEEVARAENCIISEYIDVVAEYRFIITDDAYVAYKRRSKFDKRANMPTSALLDTDSVTCFDKLYEADWNENILKQFDKQLSGLRQIMKHMDYPWLSVDLYVNTNGQVGCFEYQMEFAYEGFARSSHWTSRLTDMLCEAVTKLVDKK
jgi:hypothetical protein